VTAHLIYLYFFLRRHGAPRALLSISKGGIENLDPHGVTASLNIMAGGNWPHYVVVLRVGGSAAAAGFTDGGSHHSDGRFGRAYGMVTPEERRRVTGPRGRSRAR